MAGSNLASNFASMGNSAERHDLLPVSRLLSARGRGVPTEKSSQLQDLMACKAIHS